MSRKENKIMERRCYTNSINKNKGKQKMKRYQAILGSLGVAVVLMMLVVSYTDAQGPDTKPTPIPQQIFATAPVQVINVTTTTVEAAADGACSLIEAIVNANDDAQTHADCLAGSGADTILLEAGAAYVLTLADNVTEGDNGLPAIVSEMTISGTNATIERDAAAPPFRILYVAPTGTLTLDGLTIRGGRCISEEWGGGIFSWGAVTLNDSAVVSNTALGGKGGGIFSGGALTLTLSTICSNTAETGGGVFHQDGVATLNFSTVCHNEATDGSGGGLVNLTWTAPATMTLDHCAVFSNTASGEGGGVASQGVMIVDDSTVSHNTAVDGGGLFNLDGDLTLNDSTVSHNLVSGDSDSTGGGLSSVTISRTATVVLNHSAVLSNTVGGGIGGGGIANHAAINCPATLTLNDSLVQGNVASANNYSMGFGGGIKNGGNIGPSGTSVAVGSVTLNNSTVSGNSAVNGGGIGNGSLNLVIPEMMMVTLNNSTVSGNVAAVSAGGLVTQTGNGGGVFNVNATLAVVNSTVSGNSAQGQPVPTTQSGLGGGIANASAGITTTVMFINATLADNTGVGGGGLANAYLAPAPGYPPAVVTFGNSLIAGNSDLFGATGCLNNPGAGTATITSQGYNWRIASPVAFPLLPTCLPPIQYSVHWPTTAGIPGRTRFPRPVPPSTRATAPALPPTSAACPGP
jgi:hypothetical protein